MSNGFSFDEENIQFTFDTSWTVIKYDDSDIHRKGIMKLRDSKAVDFVADHPDKGFYLIEVKDFRGYRIKNKERMTDGKLAMDVAQKVRDTMAGLCGAGRCRTLPGPLSEAFVQALSAERRMQVILWLEEDRGPGGGGGRRKRKSRDIRGPGRRSSLGNDLKKQLRWLDCRVRVTSMQEGLPGVTLKNRKGAGAAGERR